MALPLLLSGCIPRGDLGYATAQRMTRNLVLQSLLKAHALRKPPPWIIHHSDRGSQYCADEVREKLTALGMKKSRHQNAA